MRVESVPPTVPMRRSRLLWQNLKHLLKSCIGHQDDDRLTHSNGSLIDSDRLRRCVAQREQTYEQRQQTWPYLLHVYTPSMTHSDKEVYRSRTQARYSKLKEVWQERVTRGEQFYLTMADQILKDVRRTDRHVKFFRKKKRLLFNIMMTYSVYHPHPGYSQGMTDMLTPIVYVFVDEAMSYVAFCSLMSRSMSALFDRDQLEINRRLCLFDLLLHAIDVELWAKLNSNDEDSRLFVYRWLLLDCKREFARRFDDVLRVLELIWVNSTPIFPVFVCIAILHEDRPMILACASEEDLHRYFYSTPSSRSRRATERILHRAQLFYTNYISGEKLAWDHVNASSK